MTENEINLYTAGLFDGEGTITMFKNCSADIYRTPAVSLTSTTYELLAFLKEHFGGHISKQKTYKEHHKAAWTWKLIYNNALTFVEKILPFMKEPEKRRRALLLLNEYKSLTPRNGRYTQEQLTKKLEFENRFFEKSKIVKSC